MSDALFQTERLTELAIATLPEKTKELLMRAEEFLNKKKGPMTGIDLIAKERLEQKIKHNKSVKHDYEQYPDFELGDLAAALLGKDNVFPAGFENEKINKMRAKSYKDRLVIAGALIAAQIDVLNFKEDE